MASKGIKISIATALNNAGINATRSQINTLAKSLKGSMGEASQGVRRHMADIKAGFDLTVGAIKTAWKGLTASLKSAFKFETQTTQFKTLIGDIDAAKRHMADLKALGDTPPFGLDEFAAASRQMLVMTDGVLGYKKSLELVGDAAAATGIPIEQMGHAVGRLYAFIRDGQPLSRAVMELRNMGVITPEVAQKLQDLQTAGASNVEIWQEVEKQLSRYNGAMAETEKTGTGLIGAIETRWDNAVRAFGQAFQESAKGGMTQVLEKLKELEESGSIDVWADRAARAAVKVAEAFKTVGGWIDKLSNNYKGNVDLIASGASGIGAYVGTLIGGGSFSDASKAMDNASQQTYKERKDNRKEDELREQQIMADAWRRSRLESYEKDKEAAKRAADEKLKIEKSLADAQIKIEEKKQAEIEKKRKETAAAKTKAEFADYLASGSTDTFAKWREDTGREMEAARAEFDRLFGNATAEATVTVKTENKSDKQAEEKAAADREEMFAKWFKKRKENERKANEEEAKKRKEEAKELAEFERNEMQRLHDARMAQLDAEAKKLDDQIRALEAVGADNVMARAGGGIHGRGTMDQAETERARRQRIKDNIRAIDAEQKLREKMEKSGATLDNAEEKMGRLSNLEKATLDKMRLDKARKDAEKIQKERDDREKQMATDLSAINKRLQEVGL